MQLIYSHRMLDTVQIPFEMGDNLSILICNSNVRHELSHSEYPTRRKQCAQALELMGLSSYRKASISSMAGKREPLIDYTLVNIKMAEQHTATQLDLSVRSGGAITSNANDYGTQG